MKQKFLGIQNATLALLRFELGLCLLPNRERAGARSGCRLANCAITDYGLRVERENVLIHYYLLQFLPRSRLGSDQRLLVPPFHISISSKRKEPSTNIFICSSGPDPSQTKMPSECSS
jgi:hypothetical protein